ncbi:hypothetical protein F4824DRAFT_512879 [Ustulina deusta]|nr:hypothetical protein F4824DRAFT_512879 [Ustulina deusta]
MGEEKLYRAVLFDQLRIRVGKFTESQILISYHINGLQNGDAQMRDDFRIIQKWYSRVLKLSTAQVRAYMELVDIDELKGFSEQLITRPFELEDYQDDDDYDDDEDDDNNNNNDNDNNADSQLPDNPELPTEGSPSQTELMDLNQADEEIMRSVGLANRRELELYLDENVPSYSPPSLTVLPDTQITQDTQQDPANATYYDNNGFYVGGYNEDENMKDEEDEKTIENEDNKMTDDEDEEIKDTDDGESITQSISSPSPFTDEAEGAIEEQFLLPVDSTPAEFSSPGAWSSFEYDVPPNSGLDLGPSLDPYEPPPDTPDSEGEDESLSEALQSLLVEMNGDPETRRSYKALSLTDLEVSVATNMWAKRVAGFKASEARKAPHRHTESWVETDWLDGFDVQHCQFNWQTEGLFLCLLTELLCKREFEQARTTFWAARTPRPSGTGRRRREKLPGSPLRNEFLG